ncbi:MAG: polysaccharide deacetylase family protein [Tannerella sp.]|jgi:hypothetical protein|nr:polysaccharide deacetylase family protein [Tannerella sp.]
MNDIIRYIIQFLVGTDSATGISDLIGYTSDETSFHNYKVIIYPSDFFDQKIYGTAHSMPVLPLKHIDDIPILFGQALVEQKDGRLIVYADIIAGSFFLLSRYEEIIQRNIRDKHGRFPGKESLPFRAGFIHRPVVDEYGRLLRDWLSQVGVNVESPPEVFQRINLTHDVDAPFFMRTWRNIARGIRDKENIRKLLKIKFGPLENDPFYTFPWFLKENEQVQNCFGKELCTSVFFMKAGGNELRDKPRYNLYGKDIKALFKLIANYGGIIGLHSSYQAGRYPDIIPEEKNSLEKAIDTKITANRHHFLASREPEDMAVLEQAGITDDYTMGYADMAGFRLGTSRPVRWIDAGRKRLSSLQLHPLTIMDGTLIGSEYMGLNQQDATLYCQQLIRQTQMHHGELTLLWHNTSAAPGCGYLKELYHDLLEYIKGQK